MIALPSYICPEVWSAFIEQRGAMKKIPFTPGAQKLLVMKLMRLHAEGFDSNALLEQAAIAGWRSIYPDDKMRIKHAQAAVDPALAKIEADRKAAAPMPESVRQKLGLLRQGTL